MSSELEPARLAATLGLARVRSIEPVSGGADTRIWKVQAGGESYAVRLFRSGQSMAAEREREALDLAGRNAIPVPRLVASTTVRGRPVTLLSWLPGRPLLDVLREAPAAAEALGWEFGRVQAAVNCIPAPVGWRPDAWLRWAGPDFTLGRAPASADPAQADETMPGRLLHLDYHPLNVLVLDTRISGVVDWVNARSGPPAADFARTYSILTRDPWSRAELDRPGRTFRRAWAAGYAASLPAIAPRTPYLAWSGAVMARDLAGRAAPDQLDDVRAWSERWARRACQRRAGGR